MTQTSAFKTPEGEAAYLASYGAAMERWPVQYEEIEVPGRFGTTHVVVSGPADGPPLVLLHGFMVTLTMWSPNVAELSGSHRVYAIDVMGQPNMSVPDLDSPISDAADFAAWLGETLDGLSLDRVSLVGMSFGGWLALGFAMARPERIRRLVLLSPAGGLQPLVRQFSLRGMLMGLFPTRFTVNSLMGWMGFSYASGDEVARSACDLFYLGMKHFRLPPETSRILPSVFTDDELRVLRVPVLLLIGDREVIYDPAEALARARRLIPNLEGELVPDSGHEMCASQHEIVDARVLGFLI